MEREAQETDDLDAFILEYMKYKKFEKCVKLFDSKKPRVIPRQNIQRTVNRFEKYLNEVEKVKSENYDLGFGEQQKFLELDHSQLSAQYLEAT